MNDDGQLQIQQEIIEKDSEVDFEGNQGNNSN